jgi:hypothetical protein
MLCVAFKCSIDFLIFNGYIVFQSKREWKMPKGKGLRIVRIENEGANKFPVSNGGPQQPSELAELCVQMNDGRSESDDRFAVHDEDGNVA